MKTVEELYGEIIADEELKKRFAEAEKNGKTTEFIRELGCGANDEEISSFLAKLSYAELSDDELDNVAGGACTVHGRPWKCVYCWKTISEKEAKANNGMHAACYRLWQRENRII